MKTALMFCLAALLALSMCACSSAGDTSTYTVGEYVVDRVNCTISDGMYTYQYTFSGDASGYSIDITYPDGSTYWWHRQMDNSGTGSSSGGWSDDYDEGRYVSGDTLREILVAGAPRASKERSPGMTLFGIVMLVGGLFNTISPQTAWYLSDGWKFKDAEPSDAALGLTRVGGAACILIGAILIFAS